LVNALRNILRHREEVVISVIYDIDRA